MSKSGSRDRRRSIFGIPSFTHIHPVHSSSPSTSTTTTASLASAAVAAAAFSPTPSRESNDFEKGHTPNTLKKRQSRPSLHTNLQVPPHIELVQDDDALSPVRSTSSQFSPTKSRPSLSSRPPSNRPASSVFGSLRSTRSNVDDDLPLGLTHSNAHSTTRPDVLDPTLNRSRLVLHHGEVQTSSSMFRKKKEYLALTETHIIRYKSQSKAAESLTTIPSPHGRSPPVRHASAQSVGSSQDLHSLHSDSSGDKESRVPLRQIVAAHKLDDGKPYFAIEVCYLDEESTQASAMTMQFADPDDRSLWLRAIRQAANQARLHDSNPISAYNSRNAARAVERAHDYDPSNFSIYKVIQRASAKPGRSSTDDLAKMASTVCFLAIGIHKVHVIPLAKANSRTSSPHLLLPTGPQPSHGILTLTSVRVHVSDDSFELTFRQPLKRPQTLYLASLASHDIAIRLHHSENILRPDCDTRLYRFAVPVDVEDQLPPPVDPEAEEHHCFERTLTAYCIAYDVNPSNICYTIDYSTEDAPTFQLLPLADKRRSDYSIAELLAVMRALRYNESFGSLSFAGVRLDVLNGTHDTYGYELVCTRTKKGTPIRLSADKLNGACLLVQEVRALAATNKKLRRMDFSATITTKPPEYTEELEYRPKDIGCGIVEALFPLCRHQTTNVDWIALNDIHLSETDLDYLVGAAVDKACHFRAVELSRCSLTDRTLNLILDAFRAQENTLEALDISGNLARLSPAAFDSQISIFGFIRKLNLAHTSRINGSEPLLSAETLLTWRLSELRLTGTSLNEHTVEALTTYLRHPQSNTLRELFLDYCYLTGSDIANLMQAMASSDSKEPRHLHLDISHNNITKDYDKVCKAIAADCAPTHVTVRAVEFRDESVFRHLVNAIRANKSIKYLDISRASLPNEVGDETSQALERLFAENEGLEDLNISGEESRLETSRFGAGFNRALIGLRYNTTLHVLHLQYQRLGHAGGIILANILRDNKVLRELHCEHNEIPLPALTDMINALGSNTTLVHLPSMDEERAAALKQTEIQVKMIRDDTRPVSSSKLHKASAAPAVKTSSFGMLKGFASAKKSINKTASAYTPSFPSLQKSTPPNSGATRKGSVASSKTKLSPTSPTNASLPSLSDQDIQAAMRLVAESWDRQQYRLQQYLQRNLCILQGIPTAMEIKEEVFERPISVGSLSKIIERVKIDSTPTAEKELDFGFVPTPWVDSEDFARPASIGTGSIRSSITTPDPPQLELPMLGSSPPAALSFKQFMFDIGSDSPEERRASVDGGEELTPALELGPMDKSDGFGHGLGLNFYNTGGTQTTQQGFFD
ncbi:hypothetical protein AAFC00_002899 [Neodothiora populina]|uniref:PH domain-containing protein n=1 Tax=Neodothiora populina TaxID=2781224 RepID=A0ABR3P8W4_9PEZI